MMVDSFYKSFIIFRRIFDFNDLLKPLTSRRSVVSGPYSNMQSHTHASFSCPKLSVIVKK